MLTNSFFLTRNCYCNTHMYAAMCQVVQYYKYKNMKAALANIPAGKDIGGSVSTKVGGV